MRELSATNGDYFSFTSYFKSKNNGTQIASYLDMKLSLLNLLEKAFIVILLTFILTANADALPRQSQGSITNAVKKFIIQQGIPLKDIQVSITSISKKRYLPQCSQPLSVTSIRGIKLIGRTKLRVSCRAESDWKVNVSAFVDGKVDVLVARQPIVRGSILQEPDMEYAQRLNSQLNHGYYRSSKQLHQMEAKRNIKIGQVFTPGLLKAQKLVLRGQLVSIIAQTGNLNLRVKGKALMDGQRGQTIKVKNLSSKKLIYAKVISSGVVKVNF